MGPFDREVGNGIDEMFDWDHDGMISPNEEANICQFYEETSGDSDSFDDDSDLDDDRDEYDSDSDDSFDDDFDSDGFDD